IALIEYAINFTAYSSDLTPCEWTILGLKSRIFLFNFEKPLTSPIILPKLSDSTIIPASINLGLRVSSASFDKVIILAENLLSSKLETILNNWLVGPQRFKVDTKYKIL